jgi:hypothetical protein
VKWTLFAMVNAEEFGITSKNIDQALNSKKPDVMRFVGSEGDYGEELDLTKVWALRIIGHVGNYGTQCSHGLQARHPARSQSIAERWRHPLRPADSLA